MKAYETSATVDAEGQLRLSSVPFAPGTQVEVTIKPTNEMTSEAAAECAARLLAALDQARNTQAVGPLGREQLYDRDVLR